MNNMTAATALIVEKRIETSLLTGFPRWGRFCVPIDRVMKTRIAEWELVASSFTLLDHTGAASGSLFHTRCAP
jgi:hypothetical protein